MNSKWGWLLFRLTRKLWFRATLISLLAVVAALVSLIVSPHLPEGLSARLGAEAVSQILNIIASSMLAVTTFSLTTMVSAYAAASSNVTPRATRLLMEDPTTQNLLGTFVGSFLFSLVAIITLSTGAYGEEGRVVLFAVTILVVLLIVITLLRWIDYVIRLGRVNETTERVEAATRQALQGRIDKPHLGGVRRAGSDAQPPSDAKVVHARKAGYVQHVDMSGLQQCAREHAGHIWLEVLPGDFVEPERVLAFASGKVSDMEAVIRGAISIGEERSFDQDPRFGLAVLAEIASRALSPGINDPGTAIDVLGRGVRLLLDWPQRKTAAEAEFDRVHVRPLETGDLLDDVFAPIARDGAAILEVQLRLQKALAALCRGGDAEIACHALRQSRDALTRSLVAMTFEPDRERIRQAAREVEQQAAKLTPQLAET
jgi:uncharacterized membrane protein